MASALVALAVGAIGYLIGALPVGVVAGRLGGVDPTQHGSGRSGATNVLRTLGPAAAAAVLLLDVAKGVAAVLLVPLLVAPGSAAWSPWLPAVAGIAAVAGHNWSALIGFRGGRGVATSAGALLVLSAWTVAILLPVVGLLIWRTRFVSLGSMTGAALAPLLTAALKLAGLAGWDGLALAAGAGFLVLIAHRDNLARLRDGTERRLGEGATAGR